MSHAASVLVAIATFLSAHQDSQTKTAPQTKTTSFTVLVRQGGTNQPIPGALVTVDNKYKIYTNKAGVAVFENVELEGDSPTSIEKPGYQYGALTVFLSSPPNTQYLIDIGYAEKMPRRRKKHR